MPERDSYAPGLASWIDLGSPDPDASAAFYGALFGWTFEEGPPEAGGYRNALLKDRRVAGLGPQQAEGAPWWSTYFATADADAAAAAVETNGGKILAPPMQVMDLGRMAVFADPEGVQFSVWQPGAHPGAGLRDEHGTLAWTELMTRDLEGARAFYGAVLGWSHEDFAMGEGVSYNVWKVGDDNAGGAMPMVGDNWPAELPAQWMVYFEVDDCDAMAARVKELGGSVPMPPTDIPDVGRFAVCNGPHGEAFAIIKSAQPGS